MTEETLLAALGNTSLSSEPSHKAAKVLWETVPPFLLLIGTFGNVMTMLVMRGMTTSGQSLASMAVYFTALAVFDQIGLTVGLTRYMIISYFHVDLETENDFACKVHRFAMYVSGHCSVWTLVAMTSQRVVSVLWPLRLNLQSTKKKSVVVVSVIVCSSLVVNSSILVFFSVFSVNGTKSCYISQKDVLFWYEPLEKWSELALLSVLPFCILAISNTILLRKVNKSANASAQMTSRDAGNSRVKKASSLSVTLVINSVAFLVLTLPAALYPFFERASSGKRYRQDTRRQANSYLASTCCGLLWYCNFIVNFHLYCLTGSKFRLEAREVLKRFRVCRTKRSKGKRAASREMPLALSRASLPDLSFRTEMEGVFRFVDTH